MRLIQCCGISNTGKFHSLWKLPALPLTERLGSYAPDRLLAYDQELVISVPTGHVQLRRQLDPTILYTDSEYSFRTGASDKSRRGVAFFIEYLQRFTQGRQFQSVVDIGGNDLFVARSLTPSARHCAVIDPICSATDGQTIDGIKVYGRFIEQVDLSRDLPRPDLVICRHTLEHIGPRK